MKKIAVVSDVHCSPNWYKIQFDKYDKVIFVGDYFDSFNEELKKTALENLKNIIDMKHKYNNVILLLGNHDLCQYMLGSPVSGKDYKNARKYQEFLLENKNEFAIVSQAGKYLVSHAGVSKAWCSIHNIEDPNEINDLYNKGEYKAFDFNGIEEHGDDITQGPLWIRPRSLCHSLAYPYQIVGHTPSFGIQPFKIEDEKRNVSIIIIDGRENCFVFEIESEE